MPFKAHPGAWRELVSTSEMSVKLVNCAVFFRT